MNTSFKKTAFGVLLFAFTLAIIIWALTDKKKLAQNHALFNGAYDCTCEAGGRGNAGTIFIEYRFDVNGKIFLGSRMFKTMNLSLQDCERYFTGKFFPVLYYPPNPDNSTILITPDDFKDFNYPFPDSLGWVKQYIKG